MKDIVKFTRDYAREQKLYLSGLSHGKLPTAPLFPHQREPWSIFINSRCFADQLAKKGKKPNRFTEMFLCLSRRAGKDFFAFQCALTYCLSAPLRITYYMFPELRQAVEVIFDGSMSRPFPSPDPETKGMPVCQYLKLIPGQYLANVNKKDTVLEFTNGSKIYFGSLNRAEKRRGAGAGLCIASEFAFGHDKCLDPIRPMIQDAKGMIIMISTPPEFKNFSYDTWVASRRNDPRLFPEIKKNIKKYKETTFTYTQLLTAPQLCDQYGRRIVSDEFLDKERKRMGDDYVDREYFCKWLAGGEGSVYGKTMSTIRARGQLLENIPVMPGSRIVVGMDLGVTEHTALVFAQISGYTVQFIDHYIDCGRPIEHYLEYIKQWERDREVEIDTIFGPHDINYKNIGSSTMNKITGEYEITVVAEIAQRMGVELYFVPPPRPKSSAIQLCRTMLYRSQFADTHSSCGTLVKHLEQLHYMKDTQTNEFTDKIVRGKLFCHSCDAVQTLALGLESQTPGFLTSRIVPEDKPKGRTIETFDYEPVPKQTDSRITF